MTELLEDIFEKPEEQAEEEFIVTDDKTAEWCLQKIHEAEEEKASWKEHYDRQYQGICASCDATIANMMHYLEVYFGTVKHKVTATEENYRLPSGKLVLKKQSTDFERDDAAVISWLKENGGEKFIKVKEVLDWAALKKTLSVCGESVADEDGQIIPGISAVEKPAEFKIAK